MDSPLSRNVTNKLCLASHFLFQIVMDLSRVGRMLGMAIILTASLFIGWLLVEQLPSSLDTFSYYEEDGQVVEVHPHNVITYEVMYS